GGIRRMVMGFSVGVAFGLLDNTGTVRWRQPGLHNPALLLKTNGTSARLARQEFCENFSPRRNPRRWSYRLSFPLKHLRKRKCPAKVSSRRPANASGKLGPPAPSPFRARSTH